MSNRPSSLKSARKAEKIRKHFVRYSEGAELYCMSERKFVDLAKEAKAVYKIDQTCLVNTDLVDQYLETFRIWE